jgi:hypothetical protein
MPSIFVTPEPNAPFGPGAKIVVENDSVGPLLHADWTFEWLDLDDNSFEVFDSVTGQLSNPFTGVLNWGRNAQLVEPIPTGMEIGDSFHLKATLSDWATGFSQSVTQTVKLNYEASPIVVSNQIANIDTQAAEIGVLTAKVDSVLADITRTFAPGIISTIGDLLLHPGPNFMVRELIGDYELIQGFTRPAPGIGVNAFGLMWEVQSYGPGIGLDPTVPQLFETRLLSIEQRHTLADDHEYTSDATTFSWSNGIYLFQPSFPTQINVAIVPSVVMRFWWLLAGV